MYQIISHVKPTPDSEHFGEVKGAYAVLFIDYKDIDGAFAMTQFYLENEGWEIIEIEDEYYVIERKDDMGEDYKRYYSEILEYGYSTIFNLYKDEEDEEDKKQ